MTTERGEFDAGNEFADPKAALAAAFAGGGDTSPPVPEGQEAPNEAPVDTSGTWADPAADGSQPAAGAPKPSAPAAPATLKVKGDRSEQEFKLDPTDEALTRTLKYGMAAPRWRQERDAAREEAQRLKAQLAKSQAPGKRLSELEALTQRGHAEQAVRMLLGDANYAKFVQELGAEVSEYASADPTRRMEIERARDNKSSAFREWQAQRAVEEREAKLNELQDRIESDRLRSLGTQSLQEHNFKGFVEDADLAHNLNQKLWRLAWTEIEEAADAGQDVTPELVQRAFASNAKVLRAGMQRQVQAKVAQVVETKKADAKAQAQVAATERYPRGTPDLTGWDGRSSKDLLKRLLRS